MATDNDIKKEFNEAYSQAHDYWTKYLTEAKKDLEFSMGKQWDPKEEAYLKAQGREVMVFRKNHRVIKLITGYERKNRLSIKADPVEGSDERTANQLSSVMLFDLSRTNAYHTISDAFEQGPLKTGMNLINIYVDYSQDPLNGDIRFKRLPYNRFLIDHAAFERDFSDCGFLLRREYMAKQAVKSILPASKRGFIKDLSPKGRDDKFPQMVLPKGLDGKDLYTYDEFWRRTYEEYTLLIEPLSGRQVEWTKSKKELEEMQRSLVAQVSRLIPAYPGLKEVPATKKTVKVHILIEGEVAHTGPEPSGIEDYPFVPLFGFWDPEYGDDSSLKVQSIARVGRDPQTEVNKRRSKMLDIIDSQIASGWMAKTGSVDTPKALYQSGQAQVIWINEKVAVPIEQVLKKIDPAIIPQGLFQLTELMDRDVMEIPGATAELLGSPENDDIQVAGILAKLRSNNALTVLQDLFDNLRLAKKQLGNKVIKAIQKNYDAEKVQRIINEQPTAEFYKKSFGKYDAAVVEGLLTDTQRQMYFTQIFALKQAGAPIPWAAIIDAAPIEDKKELKEMVAAEEKAMRQQAQAMGVLQQLETALKQSKLQSDMASIKEKLSQAEENRTNAMLDRAKMVKELEGMDFDRVMKILELMKGISEAQQLENMPTQGSA